jgi:amino acid adenylation domain-containing protein
MLSFFLCSPRPPHAPGPTTSPLSLFSQPDSFILTLTLTLFAPDSFLHMDVVCVCVCVPWSGLVGLVGIDLVMCSVSNAVFGVDYRVGPVDVFPSAHEDCLRALRYVWSHGPASLSAIPCRSTVLAGDSAGGGLAVGIMLAIRDINAINGHEDFRLNAEQTYDDWIHEAAKEGCVEMPVCCGVISPWLDIVGTLPSYKTKYYDPETYTGDCIFTGPSPSRSDPIKHRVDGLEFVATYAKHQGPVSEESLARAICQDKFQYLSPLHARDLTGGLPPLLIQVGGEEVMLDESVVFSERARKVGMDVRLEVWPRMWHDFPLYTDMCGIEALNPREDGEEPPPPPPPSSSSVAEVEVEAEVEAEEEPPEDNTSRGSSSSRRPPLRLIEAWRALQNLTHFVRSYAGTARANTRYPVLQSQAEADMFAFNNNFCPWPRHMCIHHLFEQRAKAFPDDLALVDKITDTELTFGEMHERVKAVATRLIQLGVNSDVGVAILLPHSIELVVSVYGTLAAGGYYIPLGLDYPAHRMTMMLNDARPKVLLTHVLLANTFGLCGHGVDPKFGKLELSEGCLPLCVDNAADMAVSKEEASQLPQPLGRGTPANLVYSFFTSGTTGAPKGVAVEHRALVKRSTWMQRHYPMLPGEYLPFMAAFTFGVSEFELFGTLPHGGTLVVGVEKKNTASVWDVMTGPCACKVAHFVPSALGAFLDYCNLLQEVASRATNVVKTVRTTPRREVHQNLVVICCGEALSNPMCRRFYQFFPTATLVNIYGPTEADMTVWTVPRNLKPEHAILVGRPVNNTRVYLLDPRDLRPVPVGRRGEIYFGGHCAPARGYVNLPEATSKAFLPDPFSEDIPDGRLYKTGDLGRWNEAGELEYLGRADSQVKIHGFRIELGSVESVVSAAPTSQAVTRAFAKVYRADPSGIIASPNDRLLVYVTPLLSADDLHVIDAYAKSLLPPYMIPNFTIPLHTFPLTAERQKLDTKALPLPPALLPQEQQQAAAVEPSGGGGGGGGDGGGGGNGTREEEWDVTTWTTTETELLPLLKEVLKTNHRLGLDDDFFVHGGNSLLAGMVVSRIRLLMGANVPGTLVYQHSTVRKIAAVVDQLRHEDVTDVVTDASVSSSQVDDDATTDPKKSLWRGLHATDPLPLVVQGIGIIVLEVWAVLSTFGFLLPVFVVDSSHPSSVWQLMWQTSVITALTPFAIAFGSVVLKWAVLGRTKPGAYPIWGSYYLRWWFVDRLLIQTTAELRGIFGGTLFETAFLKALGCNCSWQVDLDVRIFTPDLVTIGENVRVEDATIQCASLERGELVLQEVVIHRDTLVDVMCFVVPGTVVPPGTKVGALSSTSPLWNFPQSSLHPSTDHAPVAMVELWLRTLVVPFFMLYNLVASCVAIAVLHNLKTSWGLGWAVLALPYAVKVVMPETVFASVVFVRYARLAVAMLVGGALKPMLRTDHSSQTATFPNHVTHAAASSDEQFDYWCMRSVMCQRMFKESLALGASTELLSLKYRLLGAQVGKRVQSEVMNVYDFTRLRIGDYCVMGSSIHVNARRSKSGHETIEFKNWSNVLDHCCIQPGVVVEEAATTGTFTIAPEDYCFRPFSISTGNDGGSPIFLRLAGSESDVAMHLAPDEKMLVLESRRRILEENVRFYLFNVGQIVTAYAFDPLITVGPNMIVIFAWIWLATVGAPTALLLPLLVVACGASWVARTLLLMAYKWVVNGAFTECKYSFFGMKHFQWTMLLRVVHSRSLESASGSQYVLWVMRSLGVKVGVDVCTYSPGLEHDLLEIGDRACINETCDTSAHSVENMVMKMVTLILALTRTLLP